MSATPLVEIYVALGLALFPFLVGLCAGPRGNGLWAGVAIAVLWPVATLLAVYLFVCAVYDVTRAIVYDEKIENP